MRISGWSSDVCSSDLCQQTEARIDIGDEGLRELVDDVEVVHDGVPSDPVLLARRVGAAVAEKAAELGLRLLLRGGRTGALQRLRPVLGRDHFLGLELLLGRSEEHTSELQSLMRISYAVFCLKKKNNTNHR